MSDKSESIDQGGEAILTFEVCDEALEAAANATIGTAGAMSFPSAPTVSILVMCCGNG